MYEIRNKQGQYTDFLNTLSRWQQNSRIESDITGDAVTNIYVMSNNSTLQYRNRIMCPASGNGTTQPIVFSCDRLDRSCNYLSWQDGCAYMDWAGLRPMTELEVEKACRGPLTPVPGEYAWGSTSLNNGTGINGTENGTETLVSTIANICYGNLTFTGGDGGQGPLRCGIFARTSTSRRDAGATYWGIMEMSGNVVERHVTLGNSTGRLFDGLHGDGELSVNGNGDVANWPGLSGGQITGATGSGSKLGYWSNTTTMYIMISSRNSSSYSYAGRISVNGFRGGHSAPTGVVMKKNMPGENKGNE